MERMRKAYDGHLSHWKAEAVPYNNYQPYGIIFDRNAPWAEKVVLLPKPKSKAAKKPKKKK